MSCGPVCDFHYTTFPAIRSTACENLRHRHALPLMRPGLERAAGIEPSNNVSVSEPLCKP